MIRHLPLVFVMLAGAASAQEPAPPPERAMRGPPPQSDSEPPDTPKEPGAPRSPSPLTPTDFAFSGLLGPEGVTASRFDVEAQTEAGSAQQLLEGAFSFRAHSWALIVVRVRNLAGTWAPGMMRIIPPGGPPVEVRTVRMDRPALGPGESGLVAVELVLTWKRNEIVRLELLDPDGVRRLPILQGRF